MEFMVPVEELLKRFTYYDYAVFIGMLTCSGALGLWCAFNGGPQNTIRQLLAADGQLPPILVSTSLMASFISASYILAVLSDGLWLSVMAVMSFDEFMRDRVFLFVGNVSEIYTNGTMYFYIILSYCLVIPITAHIYLPVFYQSGLLTCYEYLEVRFNRLTRCIAVVCYVIQMLIYISIQLYAPALALSYVTGMSLWSAVVAIGTVCTVYTSVGGIKAVVYTDSFQAVCMIIAMTIVVALGFQEVGGFWAAWEIAKKGDRIHFDDASINPTVRHTVWGMLIGSFFTNAASYATNQMMVLRYFTVSSLKRAKLVVWGNLPYLTIILTLSCLSGLMTYAYFHDCDPVEAKQIQSNDQLLPYFVMVVLGKRTGIPGVFVAGIFAASLSSISSGVNSLANVFYVDVISLIWPNISNKTGSRVINVLGVFFGVMSIALVAMAQSMGDVLSATNAINSGIGGPLLGLFSVAMFLPFVNTKGALSGFVVSLTISLWLNIGSFLTPPPTVPLPPPISITQCYPEGSNSTSQFTLNSEEWIRQPGFLDIYRISYIWYTAISFVLSFLIAIPISLFTEPNDPKTMNPNLIARPFDVLCPWLSEKTRRKLAFYVGEDYETEKTWNEKNSQPKVILDGNENAAYVGSIPNIAVAVNDVRYRL